MSKPGRLKLSASHLLAMAIPTLLPAPWPSGPVVVSTPVVKCDSGCPGVLLSICRKRLISSIGTESSLVTSPLALTARTPARCSVAYSSNEAWPAARPTRSRFVLSAGHASMMLYATLHLAGVRAVNAKGEVTDGFSMPMEEIKRFRQIDSRTPGHPESHLTTGVETTTGPLG